MFQRFWAIVIARNKEYWADTASLFFSFVVPPLLIVVMSLVFRDGQMLFKVATHNATLQNVPEYISVIEVEDTDRAIKQIKHHQYDLFIEGETYWVNPLSTKGKAVQQILQQQLQLKTVQVVEGKAVRYIDWVIPGILGMNLMFSSFFGIGFVIVRYRKNGVLKRLRATPLTANEFVLAQLFSRLIILMIISVTIFTLSNLVLNFLVIGSYFNILLVALVGNIAMLSMALVVASRLQSEELANTFLNMITLPMLLLSEAWFSLDNAPIWVQKISTAFPLTHMVGATRDIMLDGATLFDIADSLIYLIVITVVSLLVANRIFKWQ